MRTKPFIDKKKAVTFHLVHERIDKDLGISSKTEHDEPDGEEWLGEATKFGIFFDDQHEYNYLKHLREIGRSANAVWVPVAASTAPENHGKIHLDEQTRESQEITENNLDIQDVELEQALDALEDEAFINDFTDDFVKDLCKLSDDDRHETKHHFSHPHPQDGRYFDDSDDSPSDQDEFDARTAVTGYSMTSASVYRNSNLGLLDDRFDKLIHDYSDSEIGNLHSGDDSLHGDLDIEKFDSVLDEFLDEHGTVSRSQDDENVVDKAKIMSALLKRSEFEYAELSGTRKWDCETIHSVFSSNTENRPKVVSSSEFPSINRPKIKLSHKTGLPLGVLKQRGDFGSSKSEKPAFTSPLSTPARSKDETKEEKKIRKENFREAKKERRTQKKITKEMFKREIANQKNS